MPRCNCENLDCPDHRAAGCQRQGIPSKRLLYVGAVCWECWHTCDPKYRVNIADYAAVVVTQKPHT